MTADQLKSPRKKLSTAEPPNTSALGRALWIKGAREKGACSNSIPYIKIGARVLYDPDDLDAYTARNKRRCTSENTPAPAEA